MITPEMKDRLLEMFVEGCDLESSYNNVEISEFRKRGIDFSLSELKGILERFQQDGLISGYKGLANGNSQITGFIIHERAHQKLQRGGYQMEELILLKELDKLNEELNHLQTKFKLSDLTNLTSIVNNMTTLLNQLFR